MLRYGQKDLFPEIPIGGLIDTDSDGVPDDCDAVCVSLGMFADDDDDGDGITDLNDAFPIDSEEWLDTDSDGTGDNADEDADGDGEPDISDALPLDPAETLDTDEDGIGNQADTDDDGDGVADVDDVFPIDAAETTDTDLDGIGNNADIDDDNDGAPDVTSWVLFDKAIPGETFGDWGFVNAISSDGSTLAIGSPNSDSGGVDAGKVRTFDSSSGAWVQKGGEILGKAEGDAFGFGLALSDDGATLAVGAVGGDENGQDAGVVVVFDWDGSNWLQRGNPILGEFGGDQTANLKISADGNVLAVASTRSDANGEDSGQVRVFEWLDGSWLQIGESIRGSNANDWFGVCMSMSHSGDLLAIGSQFGGYARVFEFVGGDWLQKGSDIGELACNSLSLAPDGSVLVLGDGNINQSAGIVRTFRWDGNDWTKFTEDIHGFQGSNLGVATAVSRDPVRLAVGAPSIVGGQAPQTSVYELLNDQWIKVGLDINGVSNWDSISLSITDSGERLAVSAFADSTGLVYALDLTPADKFPLDSSETLDTDGDGIGNNADTDDDSDSINDDVDNCPRTPNSDQANADDDSSGNLCDNDDDNDGLPDTMESEFGTNPLLADSDADGSSDDVDNCPLTSNEDQKNTDADPYGNACDEDDDGDGYSDIFELDSGTDALDASSYPSSGGYINARAWLVRGDQLSGRAKVRVQRLFSSKGDVSVSFRTLDGVNSKAGHSYVAASGTLTWAEGDTQEKVIEIDLISDERHSRHNFYVELYDPSPEASLLGWKTMVYYDGFFLNKKMEDFAGFLHLGESESTFGEGTNNAIWLNRFQAAKGAADQVLHYRLSRILGRG